MSTETAVATAQNVTTIRALRAPAPADVPQSNARAGFFDEAGFALIQRVSKAFASSSLVPKEYQGNISNCMIALNLAQRLGADALMVMQNLYIVHGRPGWSAQFLIATFNQNGRFSAIRYEFFGERGKDSWGCRAWAIERETGEKIVGADVTIDLSKKEGWFGKSGSKWQTMAQQMLMYRAASWMIRTHAPEIAMGLPTSDEIADTYDAQRDGNGAFTVTTDSLREAQQSLDAAVVEPPPALTDGTAQQADSQIPQAIPQQAAPVEAAAAPKPRQARAAVPEVPDDFDIE